MLEPSTLPVRDCYNNNPASIFGRKRLAAANRLIVPSDIRSVHYTVFEQESPEVNTETVVEFFENVELPVDVVVQEQLETTTLYGEFGDQEITYNTLVVVAPIVRTSEGVAETVNPFPTRGMFYRVVITYEFVDQTIAPFSQTEIIRSL